MKRYILTAAATALAVLLAFFTFHSIRAGKPVEGVMKVGFIYENDESTPYTYNFSLAQRALEHEYPERVEVLVKSNVISAEAEKPLREMAQMGCLVIFTNVDTVLAAQVAAEYPGTQFCQESYQDLPDTDLPENYHTFNGKIYQGRYVSGIAAGMKLRQLIDEGVLTTEQAIVGCVGAFPSAEVISGYTAFLLGVRSVVPNATMKVRYTNTWSNYAKEKAAAEALIREGCVVISQHTNTTGPAVACEEASDFLTMIHVGYNQSMIDLAPTVSLVSVRINWTPYITGAVDAILAHRTIEKAVDGHVHGNDMSAGLDKNWVEILELNQYIAAEGTGEKIAQLTEAFHKGSVSVFKGDYTGTNPSNPADTIDLRKGYIENEKSSAPSFHYVLDGVIEVENN